MTDKVKWNRLKEGQNIKELGKIYRKGLQQSKKAKNEKKCICIFI